MGNEYLIMHSLVYTIPVRKDNIAVNSIRSNHSENKMKVLCRTEVAVNTEHRAEPSVRVTVLIEVQVPMVGTSVHGFQSHFNKNNSTYFYLLKFMLLS